jgi:lipopolysaccharide export system protein LptA
LQRGADRLSGGRLVIDLTSGVSSLDGRAGGGSSAAGAPATSGSSGGRVTGTFSVPKRN